MSSAPPLTTTSYAILGLLAVKPWTKVAAFGPASAELYQAIVERFRERNITMPFPQREVRLLDNQ